MKIKSTEFIRKHKVEKKNLKLSISKCIGAIQLLWFLFTFCVHYTHNFIFPAFLIGVYGKPSAIKKIRDEGKTEKKSSVEFVLIRCEQPKCLNQIVIISGFEGSGLVVFAMFIFQILRNTYITNYAHHLLILDRRWTLACSCSG